jgi:hypothetical protein
MTNRAQGILAANIFDWGAKACVELYTNGTILDIFAEVGLFLCVCLCVCVCVCVRVCVCVGGGGGRGQGAGCVCCVCVWGGCRRVACAVQGSAWRRWGWR